MSETLAARIAILADTSLQRHVLQQCLVGGGYRVVLNSDPSKLDEQMLADCEADLWLLDLMQLEDSPLVDALIERTDVPVLFGEGCAPERHSEHYPRWERRLFGKLKHLVGDPTQAVGPSLQSLLDSGQRSPRVELPGALAATPLTAGEPARQVWLLAASLGGPAAVKAFLDALPGGLPVGFVYAQHIDPSFESALPQAVGRHSQWHVNPARAGDSVRCGEVVVATIEHELGFAAGGLMQVAAHRWPEPYSPSIDQMMLNLAQQFGSRCGVIAFSGMGSDGSSAAAYVRRQGGLIWTQSGESCACASMPDALREGGHSQYSGDPRELAEQLVNHLAAQCSPASLQHTSDMESAAQ
jgi:chemosensory pili system protein ChpB (putative protein-glutamate methylesterase)